jgi:hypothetical protein
MVYSTYGVPVLADCDSFVMPVTTVAACVRDTTTEFSRIKRIFLIEPSAANGLAAAIQPADTMTASDWDAVLANTGATKIRTLKGVGDLPKPTPVKIEVNGEEKTVGLDFVLNFTHNDISEDNYELVRLLQNATLFLWFETEGGYLYGGVEGIKCEVAEASHILANGKDTLAADEFIYKWRHTNYPSRILSPIA